MMLKIPSKASFLRRYLKRTVVQILSHLCARHDLMHVSEGLLGKRAPHTKSHVALYFSFNGIFIRMEVKEYVHFTD